MADIATEVEALSEEAKAAWAAVDEARRGINAAWASVLINTAVVLVAVGIPYLQRHWDDREKQAQFERAKDHLSTEMASIVRTYNHTVSAINLQNPLPNGKDLLSQSQRAIIAANLRDRAAASSSMVDDLEFRYQNTSGFVSLRGIVSDLIDVNRQYDLSARKEASILEGDNQAGLRQNSKIMAIILSDARADMIQIQAELDNIVKDNPKSDNDIKDFDCQEQWLPECAAAEKKVVRIRSDLLARP